MMKNYFFLLLAAIVIACSTKQNRNLKGNWYYFDSDSNYVEVYFSNELFSINSEWTSAGRLSYYQVHNDKVFSSIDNFNKDKTFIFHIVDYGLDTLSIQLDTGEVIKLVRFRHKDEVFTNLCLSLEKEMELIEGRLERRALILGYDTGFYEDEILELP